MNYYRIEWQSKKNPRIKGHGDWVTSRQSLETWKGQMNAKYPDLDHKVIHKSNAF